MKMKPQQVLTRPLALNIPFYSNVVALISAEEEIQHRSCNLSLEVPLPLS